MLRGDLDAQQDKGGGGGGIRGGCGQGGSTRQPLLPYHGHGHNHTHLLRLRLSVEVLPCLRGCPCVHLGQREDLPEGIKSSRLGGLSCAEAAVDGESLDGKGGGRGELFRHLQTRTGRVEREGEGEGKEGEGGGGGGGCSLNHPGVLGLLHGRDQEGGEGQDCAGLKHEVPDPASQGKEGAGPVERG